MKFENAYIEMLKGRKVKRPSFKGFWFIDAVTGKLLIHLASGEEIDAGDLDLTVRNVLAEDWEVHQ